MKPAGSRIYHQLVVIFLLLTWAMPAAAQERGAIQGVVLDAESGQPVPTAMVSARNPDGRTVGTTVTNREGRYRIAVAPDTYWVSVSGVGYGTTEMESIQVGEGQTVTVDFRITRRAFELSPMVVSVGRTYEKAISAPAHVEIVSEADIQARPAVTPVDHLRSVPGVDVISQGVQSTNVVVRGFNNIFSGALHTLTDNRIAGVPSLRVNVMHFVPSTDDDIERMEVVLGPGAALYGPNTANGVLHLITKSPLTDTGTRVSILGGERDAFGGSFRTSQQLSPTFGLKVSGQYLQAEEWAYQDPVELAERAKFQDNMEFWRTDLMRAVGIDQAEADRRISRIADRDFDVNRWSGEIRADWAISDDATAVFSTGRSNAGSQIELTGLGAAQVNDWVYSYYQARLNWDRLFGQVYLNRSDAGDTFLLRNGAPIVDRSQVFVAQLQHSAEWSPRQRFTYGLDFIYTDPETEGTINGIYEDEDDTTEFGLYLQSETQLTSNLDLVLAGRVDDHSALPDPVFSPRAALVYQPSEEQAIRVTYNRAFSTPSSLNQFLDLGTAVPNVSLAQLGYSVRVQGTGTDGFRFGGPGSYQMRSPFTPAGMGGPEQLLPAAGAAAFWGAAVQVTAAQAAQQGQPLDPQLVQFLMGLQPGPENIGANFFNIVTGETGALASLDLPDVDPIRESIQNTFEVGYKGLLADRALLAADVWYSRRSNLVTPLTIQTPLVTLNGQDIGAYLVPQLMGIGMSQEEATQVATLLAQGMAQVPVGVISSADVNANGAQLLTTYTNVDEDIDLWGIDVAAQFLLTDEWSLKGSASFVNDNHFRTDRGQLVTLNASDRKGTVGINYRSDFRGIDAELRARFQSGFPASSGVYEGLACLPDAPAATDPCVDSYTLLDANVSYRIPQLQGVTAQLAVQNLLDDSYRSFPGVPAIGRMALLRLRYEF
jgi:outer membrane receptor for ferrienterochelin and colicins